MTELNLAINSVQKSYYIFIVYSLPCAPRQLFHTFSSLLRYYLTLYPHLQPMIKISTFLRELTIMRQLPKLLLCAYPCLFCTLCLVTGSALCAPICHLAFVFCILFLLSYSRVSPSNSLSLKSFIFPLHWIISIRHAVIFLLLKTESHPTHFCL